MLDLILKNLATEGVELNQDENGLGMTQLSAQYFAHVAGGISTNGDESLFFKYIQNIDDDGPHPNPPKLRDWCAFK